MKTHSGASQAESSRPAATGHQVFFTGRDPDRLERTAAEAGALGGEIFPRQIDHGSDEHVRALFAEIGENYRLDPYWEQPMWRWDAMMGIGVRAAFVASQLATKLMREESGGLIVNISFWAAQKHVGNILYGMSKAATDKMTADMAAELDSPDINVECCDHSEVISRNNPTQNNTNTTTPKIRISALVISGVH